MNKRIEAAGGLIFNEADELLFIFRRGKWDLPKGKLDEGESLEACAVREIKEETGVDAAIVELIGTTEHEYVEDGEEITKKTWWYKMTAQPPVEIQLQKEEGIEQAAWVNKSRVHEYLSNSYQNIAFIIKKSGFII